MSIKTLFDKLVRDKAYSEMESDILTFQIILIFYAKHFGKHVMPRPLKFN